MKARTTAVLATLFTTLFVATFSFCVVFGMQSESRHLDKPSKIQKIIFSDAEVPVYYGSRPASVTKVSFLESEVHVIAVSSKVKRTAVASK